MTTSRPLLPRQALFLLAGFCAGVAWLAPAAAVAQGRMEATYEASLSGIPVGRGTWTIEIGDDTFSATAQGATAGLLKAFSGGSGHGGSQGRIVNAQGNLLQPTITVPTAASQLTISAGGSVSVLVPGSTTPTVLGTIGLTRFINKAGLQPIGDNLFTDTPASGTPQDGVANADGFGDMQQSNLEQANVEVVSEISDLIAAQRAYEMNAKVVTAADQMLQSTSNLFR